MNTVQQIKILLSFIVMVFIYFPCTSTAQIERTDQDSEQEWYSCILQSRNSETNFNSYVEIYHLPNMGHPYIIYKQEDGYFLEFVPERSRLIEHPPTEDIQGNFEKYEANAHLFEFEKSGVEIQVHEELSLNISCSRDRPPYLRKSEAEPGHWRFTYSFPSDLESECPVEENRNQLDLEEEVFALEDALGEYPEGFQIPMSVEYEKPFDTYMGVVAYGNKKEGKYQCTELVHRFFRDVYNVPTRIGLGLGHGKDLSFNLTGFTNTHNPTIIEAEEEIKLKFVFFDNGCSSQPPTPGSSISFDWGKGSYGHVAIIRRVEMLSDEMALLHLFQQAGMRSEIDDFRHLLIKDQNGFWRGKNIRGWSVPVIQ